MTQPASYTRHARGIMVLGLPLIGSHLAQFALGLTDAMMLGWYSVEALAALVLGGTWFFVFFLVGSGIASAVMPLVAAAYERSDEVQVRRIARMGAWASILFATLSIPALIWPEPLFLALGQDPVIVQIAAEYLGIAGWGIVPALLIMVMKSYLAAMERAQVVLWATLAAVGVNALINYALIFGNFGMPEMGVRGAAIASVTVGWFTFLLLAVYVAISLPEHALFKRLWRPDWEALAQVLRLGWPIGITYLAEEGLFAASAVMMGWLGTLPLAAHGVAIHAAGAMFMVYLGLSNAATVRTSQAHARRDTAHMRRGALVALAITAVLATLVAAVFVLFPEVLINLFLSPNEPDRPGVIAIGVGLLAAAAVFQLVDAGQVVALGLLRGIEDTRAPMIITSVSYWLIGIPASYLLGFTFGWEGIGVWLGLAIGLAVAAVLLVLRFWRMTQTR